MKKRNIIACLIFSIVTFGIYHLYWVAKINDETNSVCKTKTPKGSLVVLFTVLSCGIYYVYWAFMTGAKTAEIGTHHSRGAVYFILSAFGLGLIVTALTQQIINDELTPKSPCPCNENEED